MHRLPGIAADERLSWQVTSAGIREHFLIFVNPEPSPTFDRLFASLPPPAPNGPLAVKIPGAAVDTLRGIGGLVSTPVHADQGIRHVPAYSTALPPAEETARGLWVRQIAFENPPHASVPARHAPQDGAQTEALSPVLRCAPCCRRHTRGALHDSSVVRWGSRWRDS